jgi:hypothetical protein
MKHPSYVKPAPEEENEPGINGDRPSAPEQEYEQDWTYGQRRSGTDEDAPPKPYEPKGNSPTGYFKKKINDDDILLGDGFLEREGAALLAGPSGVGKSSVAMQMGCCWSCGREAFHFAPSRNLRVVMMQHEDSSNDLVRQSAIVDWLGLNKTLIEQNFWIETVRGQIGAPAVKIMNDLVKWWRADLLILNPLTAYHDGDVSQNKDNVRFLYGEIGKLLSELRIGLFAFHHKGKPPRGKNGHEIIDSEVMYELLGGSVLTNFFRGIITVSPIANSGVFKFTCAKRFEQSGWASMSQQYKWDDDRSKRLWVPASFAETENARKGSAKTLEDLRKLAPPLGSIPKDSFERIVIDAGFSRRDYRGLLAQALDDSTPDNLRLHQWSVYNPQGLAKAAISRVAQPADETHQAVREARAQERKASKA